MDGVVLQVPAHNPRGLGGRAVAKSVDDLFVLELNLAAIVLVVLPNRYFQVSGSGLAQVRDDF